MGNDPIYEGHLSQKKLAALQRLSAKYADVNKVLVTFSNKYFESAQINLIDSAKNHCEFTQYASYNSMWLLKTRFYKKYSNILDQEKGAGYYLWKPFIILHAMDRLNDGDFIIYSDCGKKDGLKFDRSILPIIGKCDENGGILTARPLRYKQSEYTKRDCFALMSCDHESFWNYKQVPSGFICLKVCPDARNLVQQWLDFCTDQRILTDIPNESGLDNFPDFKMHRHDQSILTNLYCLNNVKLNTDWPSLPNNGRDLAGLAENSMLDFACRPQGLKNVAVGKSISLSSGRLRNPNGCLKGFRGAFSAFSVETQKEAKPWIQIDLEDVYNIKEIYIFNRSGGCASRARTLKVNIKQNEEPYRLIFDADYSDWNFNEPLILIVDELARFIKLELDENETLHIDEVEVYC
ncbi:discoidin domain-containing protein [Brevundimonas sp. VNH65]|uniref:discoidin domain-containing protein n=1 Tax=Brevundimonas sp. VNH65 TaxID=3400917 RepID=UPI003C0540EC